MSRWIRSTRWAAWIPSATRWRIRTFCSIDIRGCSGSRHPERLALDELHGDVGPAVQLADVVHPAHVLVIDLGLHLGLAQEALGLRRVLRPQELQGDRALERKVVGAVHGAHPAVADQVADLVAIRSTEGGRPARLGGRFSGGALHHLVQQPLRERLREQAGVQDRGQQRAPARLARLVVDLLLREVPLAQRVLEHLLFDGAVDHPWPPGPIVSQSPAKNVTAQWRTGSFPSAPRRSRTTRAR